MRKLLIFLATATLALSAVAAGAAEPVVSTLEDRARVELTVYNHDLALVSEVREVALPRGVFTLEFRDVPARIMPATLLVESGGACELLEQNYEFDLMSRDKILEKYVGREVAWLQEDGSRVAGTLLGMTGGPVFEVGGEVVFEVPGRLALPALPQNLRARPTLVWLAESRRADKGELAASYLTQGLSWNADYVLQLDDKGREADLQAWVTLENRSGASFADAKLQLVAGDINRVGPAQDKVHEVLAMQAGARAPAFEEEALYDYHFYTLQRPATVLDNQIKQLSLFDASGVKIERRYRLGGRPHFFRGVGMLRDESKVDVRYVFRNVEASGLGMPLPAGVVRVYGRSGSGARQLLGEDRIDHTPSGEQIELTVGQAFDLVAERVRTNSERPADNLYRHEFAITLRNHKDEDVVVEVVEPMGGQWTITASSLPFRKVDAATAAFDVPVAADGSAVLTYTVEIRY